MPENCQRVWGWKKFRYVARMWPAGVTTEPPRRIDLSRHELAVVLTERAGEWLVAGVGQVSGLRPLPGGAEERRMRCGVQKTEFQAVRGEEAGTVGRRLGGRLPFQLGGKARAGPTGVGFGLVITDVADRGVEQLGERQEAVEREYFPVRGAGLPGIPPVERRLPALGGDGVPAVRQPEICFRVTAVIDKGEVVANRDEARGAAQMLRHIACGGAIRCRRRRYRNRPRVQTMRGPQES